MPTHIPHSTSTHGVLAAGERLSQEVLRAGWEGADVQRVLQAARLRFGHALCTCRREPLKLQIRLRDSKYHLAVWPQEGAAHDSECSFFRDEVADHASPVALLRAAATAPLPAPTPSPTPAPSRRVRLVLAGSGAPAGPGANVVSVRSLAHRLWEAASLCRWHPSWTRDWGRTRYQLLQAAGDFAVNDRNAEEILFMPRAFRKAQQDVLNGEWETFVRDLVTGRDLAPRILIAPVRRITPEGDGRPATVLLRHLRAPVGLAATCYEFISRECRTAISNSRLTKRTRFDETATTPSSTEHLPEVIGVFSVEGNSRGGVWARSGWLLPVHPTTYIPAGNRSVVMLVDQLVAQGYAFQYLISEVPASRRTASDWLLRHVLGPDGRPIARAALEVLNPGSSAEYAAARNQVAERMSAQGIPTWTWTPTGRPSSQQVPPLPPTDQTALDAAIATLQQIALSPHADYRYGPSTKFSFDERKTA